MDDSEFDALVTESDAVDEPGPTAEATLETLGEALSGGEREETAKWLPERYAAALTGADDEAAASVSYEEFLERVRRREAARGDGVPDSDLRARVGAVADAIAVTVPHDDLLAVRSQLPDELGSLFAEGEGVR